MMDKAYTDENRLIVAKEAVKGRKYFCPGCRGVLHFYPGTQNTPHFRHSNGVPKEIKEACALYSKGLNEYNIFNQELAARQRVRLVLQKQNDEYVFQLMFPLIQQSYLHMQINNKYFTYLCEQVPTFQFNTARLLPVRSACKEVVPLLEKYTLSCTNEQYEKVLGLRISGKYEPFREGPLIFKEMQGHFVSILYRKINLSGRFFIVSYDLISVHPDIETLSKVQDKQFYIYELIMPIEFSDDLKDWFTKVLRYTLVAATCHLDLVSPASFRKIGTTIEINSKKSIWQLTNIRERPDEQRVILVHPNNHHQILKVPSDFSIEINLAETGDYILYMDREVTDFLTLRYKPTLDYNHDFKGGLSINNQDVLFKVRELYAEEVSIETDLALNLQTEKEVNYEIKNNGKYIFSSPLRIDIPFLWSINIKPQFLVSRDILFANIHELYKNYNLYPKVICLIHDLQLLHSAVITSDYLYKEKIIYYIRRFGLKVPKPISELIQEMKLIQ